MQTTIKKWLITLVILATIVTITLYNKQLNTKLKISFYYINFNHHPGNIEKPRVLKKQRDCSNLINHWERKNTSQHVLPLFGCTNDNTTHDLKNYVRPKCNLQGYSYCGNDNSKLYFVPSSRLKMELTSPKCNLKVYEEKDKDIFLRNNLWIHMDGDSTTRNNYYDLKEYFTNEYQTREKIPDTNYFQKNGIIISFFFNPQLANGWCHDLSTWKRYLLRFNRTYPDVWIFNSGIHDVMIFKTTNQTYVDKIKCLNHAVPNKTLPIFKLNSPTGGYTKTRPVHYRVRELNQIVTDELDKKVWKLLDIYSFLHQRQDELAVDSLHYVGIGSKWITNILLDFIEKGLNLK